MQETKITDALKTILKKETLAYKLLGNHKQIKVCPHFK